MPATTPRPPSSEQVAAFDRTAWSRSIGIHGRNPRNPQALKRCGGITVVQDPSDAAIGRVPNGSMLSWAFPEAAR